MLVIGSVFPRELWIQINLLQHALESLTVTKLLLINEIMLFAKILGKTVGLGVSSQIQYTFIVMYENP